MKTLALCAVFCTLFGTFVGYCAEENGEDFPLSEPAEEGQWTPPPTMSEKLPEIIPPSLPFSRKGQSMKKSHPGAPDLLASPKMKEFIEDFSKQVQRSKGLSLAEARTLSTKFYLSYASSVEPVRRIENIEIASTDQEPIPLRLYIPKESSALPVLVYFHGGGWVFGSIDGADSVCRRMANLLGFVVVSVEYRLAPEHPFPTPLEDCYAATRWVSENIDAFGGDHTHLIVGGESSGGNLAAGVAVLARDKGGPHIEAQLLLYPPLSAQTPDEAYDSCPDQFFMTKEMMRQFWKMYLQSPGDAGNPYACPDVARECEGLPPCLIITTEYDPLRGEEERYGARLSKAGVPVLVKTIAGAIHGCMGLPIYDDGQKKEWIHDIGLLLKKLEEKKLLQDDVP